VLQVNDTHATDDVFVVGEMGFAVLAAIDLIAREIDVIGQTHGVDALWPSPEGSCETTRSASLPFLNRLPLESSI
jgi:hypothetical protein